MPQTMLLSHKPHKMGIISTLNNYVALSSSRLTMNLRLSTQPNHNFVTMLIRCVTKWWRCILVKMMTYWTRMEQILFTKEKKTCVGAVRNLQSNYKSNPKKKKFKIRFNWCTEDNLLKNCFLVYWNWFDWWYGLCQLNYLDNTMKHAVKMRVAFEEILAHSRYCPSIQLKNWVLTK